MVPHAFQVDDDVEDRNDGPQIARQRLLRGDELQALLFGLVALAVDLLVVRDDLVGQVNIALAQCLDTALNGGLHHAGHRQHVVLDLRELLLERGARHLIIPLTKAARDIPLSARVLRVREHIPRRATLYHFSCPVVGHHHHGGNICNTRGLLHVVGDDDDSI